MGNASSRFRRSLKNGDELTATKIIQDSRLLEKLLNPNKRYCRRHDYNTAVHFAALHGMQNVLWTLINDFNGNPNKTNRKNETPLHLACKLLDNDTIGWVRKRGSCVMILIEWRGKPLASGRLEHVDLSAQDENGDTPLHVAAASGLENCVQSLITAGSSPYIENDDTLTAGELAIKKGHHSIGQMLEINMVFNGFKEEKITMKRASDCELFYSFDIRKMTNKDFFYDKLDDKPKSELSVAEVLLLDNDVKLWMIPEKFRRDFIWKWAKDLERCFELAGISRSNIKSNVMNLTYRPILSKVDQNKICSICLLTASASSHPAINLKCRHNFCHQCWRTYLTNKIKIELQSYILCPAYGCHYRVPSDVVESLVGRETARRYRHCQLGNFIDSSDNVKWCPAPGCTMAVRVVLPDFWDLTQVPKSKKSFIPSFAVDCGNGHYFCWDCLEEAHAPSGCAQWQKWKETLNAIDSESLARGQRELEVLSNMLWLASNSKPCPGCKSPIQKIEGCNHVKCPKCKFEFCWFCMGTWEEHSTMTGGYFRCTRYFEVTKANEVQENLIKEAISKTQEKKDINRFIRHYTNFQNHENSRKVEEDYLRTINKKLEEYEIFFKDKRNEKGQRVRDRIKFLKLGVLEVLKLRRTVSGSYVYGYYMEERGINIPEFSTLQNELEVLTETLSEMVARPYLKTSHSTIEVTVFNCRKKRYQFVQTIISALLPPNARPDFKKGIMALSLNEDDKKSNSTSSLNSTEVNEEPAKTNPGRNSKNRIRIWLDVVDEDRKATPSTSNSKPGQCRTKGCNKPKARNLNRQTFDDYCVQCRRIENQRQRNKRNFSKGLKIWRTGSRRANGRTKKRAGHNRKSSVDSCKVQICEGVELNGGAACSSQQQTSDVGGSEQNPNPEGCEAEANVHRSRYLEDFVDEDYLDTSETSEDQFPWYPKYLQGEDFDYFSSGQSDDENDISTDLKGSGEEAAGGVDFIGDLVLDIEGTMRERLNAEEISWK